MVWERGIRVIVHTVFDVLAWISAALVGWLVSRTGWLGSRSRTPLRDPGYFVALGLGAIVGALLFGTLNMGLAGHWALGHSIAGAIAGGVIAVEVFKLIYGIRGSTGAQFVAPLATGIAVGRLGCFFAGLPDFTYGTPTSLPWGVDFGDGALRHPVQLYESGAMFLFLLIYLREIARGSELFRANGFYLFVAWYACQRFIWEFLKPYPVLFGPFNIFHIVCAILLLYSILMLRRSYDIRPAIQNL
jgi:phosphatidylglycerol---prolipoprotein diacylglyceryl transferase